MWPGSSLRTPSMRLSDRGVARNANRWLSAAQPSRRMPTPPSAPTWKPSSSGPRCTSVPHMARTSSGATGRPPRLRIPAMPHMGSLLTRATARRRPSVIRGQRRRQLVHVDARILALGARLLVPAAVGEPVVAAGGIHEAHIGERARGEVPSRILPPAPPDDPVLLDHRAGEVPLDRGVSRWGAGADH